MAPIIVWLTGWGMADSCWDKVRERLSDVRHVVPDYSQVSRPDEFYEVVAQSIPSLSGNELLVVGWSLGGMLALRLATEKRVAGLVLIGTTLRFVRDPAERERGIGAAILQRMKRQLAKDRERVMAQFVEQMFTEQKRGQNCADAGSAEGRWSQQALSAGLDYLESEDCRFAPERLSCPAVVIHGEDDVICPLGAGKELAGKLATADFLQLKNCGHVPHLVHPEQVSEAIERMVKRIAHRTNQASIQQQGDIL